MNAAYNRIDDDYIQRHYATDTDSEIALALDRSVDSVAKRRTELGCLRSRLPKDCQLHRKCSDPSPEEITAMCAKLRRRWTEIDYYNRAKWAGNSPVETTEYRVKGKANGQIVIGNPSNAP